MAKEYRVVLKHAITGDPWEGPLYDAQELSSAVFEWTTSLRATEIRVARIMNGTHARSMVAAIEEREVASEVEETSAGPKRRFAYKTLTADSLLDLDYKVNQFLRKCRASDIRSVTPGGAVPESHYRTPTYYATIVYEYDEEDSE